MCPVNIYICFCSHLKLIICLYSLWTCLSAYMRVGRKRVCFVGPPYNPYQSEDSLRRLFRLNAIQYKAVPCNTCNTIEHHGTPYHTVPELVDSSAWMAPVLKYQISTRRNRFFHHEGKRFNQIPNKDSEKEKKYIDITMMLKSNPISNWFKND